MQCNAYAAMGLAPPTYDISGRKSVMKQNLFLRDIDKSHWLKSSSQISSELFSSPTVAIEQNEVADHIIINNRLMTTSLSVAMISIASLMAIELGARVTNSLHFAISTRLLSIRFWSALTRFGPIAVRLAPIPTIMKIRKNGVGGLPLLPYSAMANLSFVLLMYGAFQVPYYIPHIPGDFYCMSPSPTSLFTTPLHVI